MYFIIAISSFRTVIPIITVLLIRKIATNTRIKITAMEIYPIRRLKFVKLSAIIWDAFTSLTPFNVLM